MEAEYKAVTVEDRGRVVGELPLSFWRTYAILQGSCQRARNMSQPSWRDFYTLAIRVRAHAMGKSIQELH